MILPRLLARSLALLKKQYPILIVTGPRQSGKTTLCQNYFNKKPYVSLEDPDNRIFVEEDPRGFLEKYKKGAIIDEVQNCPDLFSYLQTFVDKEKKMGQFILSGSQSFTLFSKVSQSLSGRASILELLPFSREELEKNKRSFPKLNETIFSGFYPPIYDRNIPPTGFYENYIKTYVERDVRQLINIQNLTQFQIFIKLCAGRTGQILNLSSLANDCGITHNTARSWLTLLEASYIIFLLKPYYKNFGKRLIKMPKLYFYDTGLLSYLLTIKKPDEITSHSMKGALYENYIIAEVKKHYSNRSFKEELYYIRDSNGNEVDLLIERNDKLYLYELKAGMTLNSDYFKGIEHYKKHLPVKINSHLIFAGEGGYIRNSTKVFSWDAKISLP